MSTEIPDPSPGIKVTDLDLESLECILNGFLNTPDCPSYDRYAMLLPEEDRKKKRELDIRFFTDLRDKRRETGGGVRMEGLP